MTTDHRLTTRQMAEFVANGFIRFDAIVPSEVNERVIEEMRRPERERFTPEGLDPPHTGTPLDQCCAMGGCRCSRRSSRHPSPVTNTSNDHLEHEFVFERRIELT